MRKIKKYEEKQQEKEDFQEKERLIKVVCAVQGEGQGRQAGGGVCCVGEKSRGMELFIKLRSPKGDAAP